MAILTLVYISLLSITVTSFYGGGEWDPAGSHDIGVNEFIAMLFGHSGEGHVAHDRHAGRGAHASGHPEMNQPWGPYAPGPQANQPWGPYAAGPSPNAAPQSNHWVAHTAPEWDPAGSHDIGVNEFLAMLFGHSGEGHVTHDRHAGRGAHAAGHPEMNQPWDAYAAGPPQANVASSPGPPEEDEPELSHPHAEASHPLGLDWHPESSHPYGTHAFLGQLNGGGIPNYAPFPGYTGRGPFSGLPSSPRYRPRLSLGKPSYTRTIPRTTTISSFPRTTTSTFPRTSTFGRTISTIPRTTTTLPASSWQED